MLLLSIPDVITMEIMDSRWSHRHVTNALPSYNFRGLCADAYSISGQCLTECGYPCVESCFACTIACKRHTGLGRYLELRL